MSKRRYTKKNKKVNKNEEVDLFLNSELPLHINKDKKDNKPEIVKEINKQKLMKGTEEERKEELKKALSNTGLGLRALKDIRKVFNEDTKTEEVIWWCHMTAATLIKNDNDMQVTRV